jgi:O-antigen biosynthesis protein
MLFRVIAAGSTPARGALLAPGVALIVLEGENRDAAALGISLRGRPLRPPYGTVSVGSERAPARIAAVRLPRDATDVPLLVDDGGECQPLHQSELAPDPLSLAAGLDQAARRKLLDFLLGFCGPAFRLGGSAPFANACARLALDCAGNGGVARVEAHVLPGRVLVSGMEVPRGSTLAAIGQQQVVHSRVPILEGALGLQILPVPKAGDLVLASGAVPVVWTVDASHTVPHVLSLPEGGRVSGSAARAACRNALGRGEADGAVTQLLREMDLLFPAQPRKIDDPAQPVGGELELATPDGAGGIFVSGWLRDPLGMVADVSLATSSDRVAVTADRMIGFRRPDIAKRFHKAAHRAPEAVRGFVAHVPSIGGSHTLQPHLMVQLRSGAQIRLTPPARSLPPAAARDAVLGCVPQGHVTPDMMQRCMAPVAARLHRAAMSGQGAAEVVRIGRQAAKPTVSILIPLYRNLGFLRFQVGALAQDPDCRNCEIIYVLDSPEQRAEVEHLLRGLHRLTGMPFTLVVMPRNLGYAAANNTGAREARAPLLLLLNSDVVPGTPGWLAMLAAPFSRASIGAAGPKLLFDDGSIQHAGLFFERGEDRIWFNRHHHKGMPRDWADAQIRRPVAGVTGAALAIRRSLFEQIGGVCEDYIIGDYEDSDLCLRVRETGAAIMYVPEAELFHFERQSIQMHAGYTRTHASLYNRLLHHARWDGAMEAAMSGPARAQRRRR